MTKSQLLTEFKIAKRAINDKHSAASAEEFIERDKEVIELCQTFLSNHPEFNENDCLRAFYPATVLAHTQTTLRLQIKHLGGK